VQPDNMPYTYTAEHRCTRPYSRVVVMVRNRIARHTGILGIVCSVCHKVLRHPSDDETSLLGKHLLPKVHIEMLKRLTVSEVTKLTSSTVDESAFPLLNRQ